MRHRRPKGDRVRRIHGIRRRRHDIIIAYAPVRDRLDQWSQRDRRWLIGHGLHRRRLVQRLRECILCSLRRVAPDPHRRLVARDRRNGGIGNRRSNLLFIRETIFDARRLARHGLLRRQMHHRISMRPSVPRHGPDLERLDRCESGHRRIGRQRQRTNRNARQTPTDLARKVGRPITTHDRHPRCTGPVHRVPQRRAQPPCPHRSQQQQMHQHRHEQAAGEQTQPPIPLAQLDPPKQSHQQQDEEQQKKQPQQPDEGRAEHRCPVDGHRLHRRIDLTRRTEIEVEVHRGIVRGPCPRTITAEHQRKAEVRNGRVQIARRTADRCLDPLDRVPDREHTIARRQPHAIDIQIPIPIRGEVQKVAARTERRRPLTSIRAERLDRTHRTDPARRQRAGIQVGVGIPNLLAKRRRPCLLA